MSSHADHSGPGEGNAGSASRQPAASSSVPTVITPALLREWALPEPGGSKYGRGQVLVIGGARQTPGAALLAGISALRVGAGRLTMAVAGSVAAALAVAVPEAGVIGLPENDAGSVLGSLDTRLATAIDRADAVLIGSGLDDPDLTAAVLRSVIPHVGADTPVVLDAFALGVLTDIADVLRALHGRLVLTPNDNEAARLLDKDVDDLGDLDDAVAEIADKYGAVVTCKGFIADAENRLWQISTGHSGLGTSGSGDVLAGAVVGLLARGSEPAQAACWGTHVHAAAGDRLTARVGALGFLARELSDQLPAVLSELSV